MTKSVLSNITMAAAFAGAVAVAGVGAPNIAEAGKVKCYGIAKAGQNDCANAAGTHSCSGHSTVDYSGQDWKTADSEECTAQNGKLEAFSGVNPAKS